MLNFHTFSGIVVLKEEPVVMNACSDYEHKHQGISSTAPKAEFIQLCVLKFKCCGVDGPGDYNMTKPIESCCPEEKCVKPKNSSSYDYYSSVSCSICYWSHFLYLGVKERVSQ